MRRSWLRVSNPVRLLGLLALVGLMGVAGACSSSTASDPGSSQVDGGVVPAPGAEAGAPGDLDGGSTDSSSASDAAANVDILGTLASGACGIVKNELTQAAPSLENNLLVFVAGEKYDRPSLSPGGQTLYDTANAGGSSTESEVMSFEVLHYCEGASLLKTETEILYAPPSDASPNTITDILVEIGGKRVGVSVTRAYKPPGQPYTDADAKALLEKKLNGILQSSARVLPADKWVKQILHVLSVDKAHTDAITRAWATVDPAVRADTIVLVTETKGGGFVYCHPVPPLGTECQ